MTIEQFNQAENILIRISELKNTIESIKFYQLEIKKDEKIDAFMVIHSLTEKKFGIQIGNKEDDEALLSALESKIKQLETDFKNL